KALQLLKREGSAELVAVAGRKAIKTEEFARKYGVKRWYTSFEQMLNEGGFDVVTISTPHYLHFPQALAAIEAGFHVLVDKPMAVSLREADEMIRRAEKKGVKLGVIFEYRFDPIIEKLKGLIEEEKLGRLIMGEAVVEWFRPQEYYERSDWRGRWATEGGGALINQAIHTIDLLLWFMGDVEELWGLTGTFAHNIEVEDLAVAALKFKNGAFGVVQGATAIYPGLPTRLEIHGTEGTAVIEGAELKMLVMRGEETREERRRESGLASWSRPEAVPVDNHTKLIKDFAQSVALDGKPRVDGIEGRRSLELIKAVYQSGRTGQVVKLPLGESEHPQEN
ncbi:MAG: Gfo/Idh/MocA family oxidoreductase, partial [Thermofilaceae archaeon]